MQTAQSLASPRMRPGRPNKQAASRIDSHILGSAWSVFLELGFDGASMEAIAERANVTRATLYQRHNDKLGLFQAVITRREEAPDQLGSTLAWLVGDTLEERLIHYAQTILIWSQNPEVNASRHLSLSARGEAGIIARRLDASYRKKMIDLLAADIENYAKKDGAALKDAAFAARMLIGMLEAVVRELENGDIEDNLLGQRGRQVVAVFLSGRAAW